MKTIYNTIKNFHALIETDQTVLRVIKTLDDNKLSKVGFGIGINFEIFKSICDSLLACGYKPSFVSRRLKFFGGLMVGVRILRFKLNGVTDYYILYSKHLNLFAIRSNTTPENKNFFPESFFSTTATNNLFSPLNNLILLEGLSGRNFGGNANLLKQFGLSVLTSRLKFESTTVILEHQKFNSFIENSLSGLNSNMNLTSYPLEESFNTKITAEGNNFQSRLIRENSKGLLFDVNENLIGVYESKLYSETAVSLRLRFFEKETLEKFSPNF